MNTQELLPDGSQGTHFGYRLACCDAQCEINNLHYRTSLQNSLSKENKSQTQFLFHCLRKEHNKISIALQPLSKPCCH